MSGKLALVTGASGFVAGHVVDQLLQKGYRVRGTARGTKVESLRKTINVLGLEFVQIDDIAKGDISTALEGVDVVFHVASPLPGRASIEGILNSAVEGTLNVLRQAEKAGIEKIVVTSSATTALGPFPETSFAGISLSDSQWGEVTLDEVQAHAENDFFVYSSSKVFAEKAVWEFARQHPKLDIATILPGFIYGPYAPHFPFPSKANLGTNDFPYSLIKGELPPPFPPFFVDVRDVAKAHVLALNLPRAAPEEKRFLINWGLYTWKQAAEYLRKAHPDLNVLDPSALPELSGTPTRLDTTRAREVLKFEYLSPEKTLDDFVESIAEVEKSWITDNETKL